MKVEISLTRETTYLFSAAQHDGQEVYKYLSELSDDLCVEVKEPRSPVMVNFLKKFRRSLSKPAVSAINIKYFTCNVLDD